jgi:TonB family protein
VNAVLRSVAFVFLVTIAAFAGEKSTPAPAQSPPSANPFLTQGRIRSSGALVVVRSLSQVSPVYPPLACQARIQGEVVVHVISDKEGKVAQVELIYGHPLLVPAALETVKQMRFRPTLLKGSPVEVDHRLTITFTMDPSQSPSTQTPQYYIQRLHDVCGVGGQVTSNWSNAFS